jgi:1,4-alpha-glucan branching enzyme
MYERFRSTRRSAVPSAFGDLETELAVWVEQLRTIDTILHGPIHTLIRLGERFVPPGLAAGKGRFPAWVSERRTSQSSSNLVHALCCSTLQRVARMSRRWAWPEKTFSAPLLQLVDRIPHTLGPVSNTPTATLNVFDDAVFRPLNPLTSAEIFWVYLNAGETWAHSGPGFVAAFGMLWATYAAQEATRRSSGDPRAMATTVLSKCLMPLKRLEATIVLRSRMYRAVAALCKELDESWLSTDTHQRWRFVSKLDQLSGALAETANVAINRTDFERAAEDASKIAQNMSSHQSGSGWPAICDSLRAAVMGIGTETANVLAQARPTVEFLGRDVLAKLRDVAAADALKSELRPRMSGEDSLAYLRRMRKTATVALSVCRRAIDALDGAVAECAAFQNRQAPGNTPAAEIRATFEKLAAINDGVADLVRGAVTPAVRSCRRVVRQEVAYASAGNDTDFDAADLLSAIAISERWDQISQLEVEDAIGKALRAARHDGSWTTGQPIYLSKRVLGVWPGTADLGWLLATAIRGKPRIRIADDALRAFVPWLVRNQTKIEYRPDERTRIVLQGWPAERRETTTIDLWTTAAAVQALLDIRDLVEHRLWELCERRFFVIHAVRSLEKVDPVDLGARHDRRLHYRLRKAARDMRSHSSWRTAEYSFVLHGPPGSSKTAVAEALGGETAGGGEARIVRITPADFTRRGEAGVDAEARFIFDLLTRVRRVTIIFDEIDDLLRRRELKGVPAFLKMIVPAMLNRLQDLRDAAPRQEISAIVAMNYIDNVEPALVRPGRIDGAIPVVYPDAWSRENTLLRIIEEEKPTLRLPSSVRSSIITKTADWPWTTHQKLCKKIVLQREYVAEADVAAEAERLRTELQDLGAAYASRDRWMPECPQLVDEVAHLLLAHSPLFDANHAHVTTLFQRPDGDRKEDWTKHVVAKIRERFTAIWNHEKRDVEHQQELPVPPMGAELVDANSGTVAFTVWVPDVSAVSVEFEGGADALPLVYREPGVWSGTRQGISPGAHYRYSITTPHTKTAEGRDAVVWRNDPLARDVTADGQYSIYQIPVPNSDFDCPGFHELVMYQIDVANFAPIRKGRYDHITDKELSLIAGMGFNAIDLISPMEPIGADAEYDPANTLKRESELGGIHELRKLVERAHAHDIAVITGVSTRYLLGRGIVDLKAFTGHESGMGIYFDDDDRANTPFGPRPAFSRREVTNVIVENARRWFYEIGLDGLRWGGIHFVRHVAGREDERTGFLEAGWRLMQEFNEKAISIPKASVPDQRRRTITIAEDAHEPGRLVSRVAPDSGHFGAQWSRQYFNALRHAILGPSVQTLAYLRNAILHSYSTDVFARVIFAESRDSLVRPSRLAALLRDKDISEDDVLRRCLLASAAVLVTPGIPMLLQGQEFGDTERRLSRELRTKRSQMVAAVERLIRLRRNFPPCVSSGLKGHRVHVEHDEAAMVLAIHRWQNGRAPLLGPDWGDEVVTLLSFSDSDQSYAAAFPYPGRWTVRFNSNASSPMREGFVVDAKSGGDLESARADVELPRYGVVVFSQNVPGQQV